MHQYAHSLQLPQQKRANPTVSYNLSEAGQITHLAQIQLAIKGAQQEEVMN
jgi:hypothetical protein